MFIELMLNDEGSKRYCYALWENIKIMEYFGTMHSSKNFRILKFSDLVDFKVCMLLLRMEI